MYRMVSVPCLVVSPTNVVTASWFQSLITVGSPAAIVVGVAAVAAPLVRAARRTAAVKAASQLGSCAFRRRIEEESWWNTRISHPPRCAVTVVEGGDSNRVACSPQHGKARPSLLSAGPRQEPQMAPPSL